MKIGLGETQAFPVFIEYPDGSVYASEGMNKRFYAACAAMQGMLANEEIMPNGLSKDKMVANAYEWADELLKQENL